MAAPGSNCVIVFLISFNVWPLLICGQHIRINYARAKTPFCCIQYALQNKSRSRQCAVRRRATTARLAPTTSATMASASTTPYAPSFVRYEMFSFCYVVLFFVSFRFDVCDGMRKTKVGFGLPCNDDLFTTTNTKCTAEGFRCVFAVFLANNCLFEFQDCASVNSFSHRTVSTYEQTITKILLPIIKRLKPYIFLCVSLSRIEHSIQAAIRITCGNELSPIDSNFAVVSHFARHVSLARRTQRNRYRYGRNRKLFTSCRRSTYSATPSPTKMIYVDKPVDGSVNCVCQREM